MPFFPLLLLPLFWVDPTKLSSNKDEIMAFRLSHDCHGNAPKVLPREKAMGSIYQVKEVLFYPCFLGVFIIKRHWSESSAFFASTEIIVLFFSQTTKDLEAI